jgi:GxxExxY protein
MEKDSLTYTIIGCSMQVHNFLGNGFQEIIYQRSLAIELCEAGINFEREVEQPVYYKEQKVGTRRADFIIEDKLVIELKAIINLENVHLAQTKNYLAGYGFKRGLLINFGATSLQYKLVFNSNTKYNQNFQNSQN